MNNDQIAELIEQLITQRDKVYAAAGPADRPRAANLWAASAMLEGARKALADELEQERMVGNY